VALSIGGAFASSTEADGRRMSGRGALFCCLIGVVLIALAACDIDVFGNDRRTVAGPYGLFVADGKFYLIFDKWDNLRPCGILEGSITELGWNDQIILAKQDTCSGKPSGWMVVHVDTGVIDPPIDSAKLQMRSDLTRIQVMPVDVAWNRLGRR
jgi:hypothetical protein